MTIIDPTTTPAAPITPRALVVTGLTVTAVTVAPQYAVPADARVWASACDTATTDAPLAGAHVAGVEGTGLMFAGDAGVATTADSDADQARKRRRSRGLLR